METFVAAYVVVLSGFILFLTRMRLHQKRLQGMVDLLQTRRTADTTSPVPANSRGDYHGNDAKTNAA